MENTDKRSFDITNNRVVNCINAWFQSDLFIVTFAVICLFSWALECEYIAVISAIVFLCYMFLTQKSLDRIIVIAILIPSMVDNNMRYRINSNQIYILSALLLVVAICAVFHFLKVHEKNNKKLLDSKLFLGYVIVVLAGAIGGLLYANQTITKVLISVGGGLVLLGLYCLLYKTTSVQSKYTVIKAIIALCFVIVVQMLVYFLRVDSILVALTSKAMSLGWAITNAVAVVLAMGIPLCFYMAYKSKFQLGYLLTATLFFFAIFLTNCRSMLIAGVFIYAACIIISLIKFNRWQAIINLLVCIGIGVAFYLLLFDKIFSQFINLGLSGNGREELYAYYWAQFKENWVFGMGFFTDTAYQADGVVRVHNTVLQILASTGIVGAICFVPYYFQRYKTLLSKPNMFKLFAILSYLAFAAYGMVDCAIISSYKLIIVYCLMFAVEQDCTEQDEKEKKLIAEGKLNPLSLGHPYYRYFFKRLFDIVLSGLALIILSPVFLVIYLLVKTKVSKKAIFMQLRPGKDNKIFVFYKFKSMTDEKDENGVMLPDSVRLKKFGKFLRKTSLDELPQLWNIFKGDMSIVGPRPKLVKDMIFYNEEQNMRSLVRPGVTGYAQANGRNLNTWSKTFEHDIFYVKNMSLWLDIKIIFTTLLKVVKGKEIVAQTEVKEAYYYGNQLLNDKKISENEFKEKLKEAHTIESAIIKQKKCESKIFCSDQCV